MRGIRTNAELFLRDATPAADLAQRLGFIVDNSMKLDRLADMLSSYALALGIEPASFQPTPVDVLLRNVLARVREDLRAQGAVVTNDALPQVRGNPDRLIELLQRLIDNALNFRGPDPPSIHVTAATQPGAWRFGVRDNGAGMDAADLERIFNPFQRGSAPRAGAGMGLAICKTIVERHGGAIWAESKPGEGTTIFFTLPAD